MANQAGWSEETWLAQLEKAFTTKDEGSRRRAWDWNLRDTPRASWWMDFAGGFL